jgi:hypothetical protein
MGVERIDIASGFIFKKLGLKWDSYVDRVTGHRKVYLIQLLGTDLGHTYIWHVNGPYSPSLASYVYEEAEWLEGIDYNRYKLRRLTEENIAKINALSKERVADLSEAEWFELLASIIYIYIHRVSWGILGGGKQEIFAKMIRHKPRFNIGHCENAFSVLKKYDIVVGNKNKDKVEETEDEKSN